MFAGTHPLHARAQPLQTGGRRTTSLPLQTHGPVNHDPRCSDAGISYELPGDTFQLSSSPANSIIEESSTIGPDDGSSNHTEPMRQTQFVVERGPISRAGSPYIFPPHHEVHPAVSAPFAEPVQSYEQTHFTDVSQSAGPLPAKTDKQPESTVHSPIHTQSTMESTKARSFADDPAFSYHPDSLAGPNVTLDNHRPGQVSHPNATVDPKWKRGLCAIDTLCCTGLFCPCVLYGKTQHRLSRKQQKQDPTNLLSYEPVNGSCGIMLAACGLQCRSSALENLEVPKAC